MSNFGRLDRQFCRLNFFFQFSHRLGFDSPHQSIPFKESGRRTRAIQKRVQSDVSNVGENGRGGLAHLSYSRAHYRNRGDHGSTPRRHPSNTS